MKTSISLFILLATFLSMSVFAQPGSPVRHVPACGGAGTSVPGTPRDGDCHVELCVANYNTNYMIEKDGIQVSRDISVDPTMMQNELVQLRQAGICPQLGYGQRRPSPRRAPPVKHVPVCGNVGTPAPGTPRDGYCHVELCVTHSNNSNYMIEKDSIQISRDVSIDPTLMQNELVQLRQAGVCP